MSTGGSDDPSIDTGLVRRLLVEQFPQWADLPLTPVPAPGMDNVTYRLGEDLSVRLPRYPRWVGQVEREHRWLPRLAPQLPLPVSAPLAMGEPGEGYPFPWSVYRWLEGETATTDGLADPVGTATELAGFIGALQGIDSTGGPGPEWSNAFRGVPMGDERDSVACEARVRPRIAALRGMVDTDSVTAVWEAALTAPAWEGPPVWIHGDLAAGNLLTVQGRLSAVIDFGTLAVGDPAVDLLPAWLFLPAGARDVFRTALDVDDATWARGRGWALASSLPVPDDPYFDDPARASAALYCLDELVADL
ncbi:aminoglycoside phosphotransferase family protein [Streptomyces sp. NPDC058545]|uniref:aminoglycoside phosphotransferase family protein n=1 Tax=Streptomyces sp. NPDC058545 TaxID=3346544 RepID=UPI00364A8551